LKQYRDRQEAAAFEGGRFLTVAVLFSGMAKRLTQLVDCAG
jgi:hypothetical protein